MPENNANELSTRGTTWANKWYFLPCGAYSPAKQTDFRTLFKATNPLWIAQGSLSLLQPQFTLPLSRLSTCWSLVLLLVSMTPRALGWPPTSMADTSQSLCLLSYLISDLGVPQGSLLGLLPVSPQVISFISSALNITTCWWSQIYVPSPWSSRLLHPAASYTSPLAGLMNVSNIPKKESLFPSPTSSPLSCSILVSVIPSSVKPKI